MDDLDNLIYEILEDSPYPVYSGWYKDDYSDETVTVFLSVTETATDFSEDDFEGITITLQFSTFSKDKNEADKQRKYIRRKLKECGFKWSDSNDDYETETEINHYADRFYYYLEEEK